MRMRVKKWARPELAACPYYVFDPEGARGRWAARFPKAQPMYLELGCGKGVSTCRMALEDPAHNYLAVDLITSVLGVARRNAEEAYRGVREVDNLILTNFHIEYIYKYLSGQDRVERIYINFCDPWPRSNQKKRRLTHGNFLQLYRRVLPMGGEIHFKSDNDKLFEWSLEEIPRFREELTPEFISQYGLTDLMKAVESVPPLHTPYVPLNSIVREFVGGSCFQY